MSEVSVMDTTLRDGEQTPNVAYTPGEKLQLARLLLECVKVDRIEVASTRVSRGEHEAVTLIADWASRQGFTDRVEVLGFCDGLKSVEWLRETGARILNLLVKGSERHCRQQLGLRPEEHRARVSENIALARAHDLTVNVYLEDWSSGIVDSPAYVGAMMDLLGDCGVRRVYLPDTLGNLAPWSVAEHVETMVRKWPSLWLEFHAHNDYGLATANCLAALSAGARGVHTSVNGLGERAGNAPLAQTIVAIHDHSPWRTRVDESSLLGVSQLVETFAGKNVSDNTPVVGQDVFTQTAGIHADGDAKGNLYATRLDPKRFGRERRYALGKLSGRASLDQNLERLGITLSEPERARVLLRITQLADKKHIIGPEDLPVIIADVLKAPQHPRIRVESYRVIVGSDLPPSAELRVSNGNASFQAKATGAGGYDAFMRALASVAHELRVELPDLLDYRVRIPPGGHTEALVETIITWRPKGGATFTTRGVDADQLGASVLATEKMLNVVGRGSQSVDLAAASDCMASSASLDSDQQRDSGGRRRLPAPEIA